jgi:hypothetical protein
VVSRTEKSYTSLKLDWLDQVESDADLPASAFKIAYRLSKHFDKDTLEGFPGIESIAEKTGLGKATVVDMVRRLEAHGHIAIKSGRPGRGHSHRYRMIIKGRPAEHFEDGEKGRPADLFEEEKRSVYESEKVGLREIKGRPAEQNTLEEHLKGTPKRERASRAPPFEPAFDSNSDVKSGEVLPPEKSPGRGKATALPQDWKPGDEDWAYAAKQGLQADDIGQEAQRFRDWTAENGKKSADWSASWRRFLGNSRLSRLHKPNGRGGSGETAWRLAMEAEAVEAAMEAAGGDPTDHDAYRRFKANWEAKRGME